MAGRHRRRNAPPAGGPLPDPAGPLPSGWSFLTGRGPRHARSDWILRACVRQPNAGRPVAVVRRHVPPAPLPTLAGGPASPGGTQRARGVDRAVARAAAHARLNRGPAGGPSRVEHGTRLGLRPGRARPRSRGDRRWRVSPTVAELAMIVARIRAIPSWQFTLGRRPARAGLPHRGAARLRGPAGPVHEPGADAARRDRAGPPGAAGGPEARILELRSPDPGPRGAGQGGAAVTQQLNDELEEARIAAGLIPLTGPGIVIQLEDSTAAQPRDGNARDYLVAGRDVRTVVEELWLAGAEAIAVNGERVTVATAIIDIGGSVLVNSAYLAPPYQVTAIGPGDMYDRLAHSPGFVDFVRGRAEAYGIGSPTQSPRVTCPPTPDRSTFATARAASAEPHRGPHGGALIGAYQAAHDTAVLVILGSWSSPQLARRRPPRASPRCPPRT